MFLTRALLVLVYFHPLAPANEVSNSTGVPPSSSAPIVLEWDLQDTLPVPPNTYERLCSSALSNIKDAPKKRAGLYLRRGYIRILLKQYSGALSDFDAALEVAPTNIDAIAGRAFACLNIRGKVQAGAATARLLIDEYPTNAHGYHLMGIYYVSLRKYEAAIKHFTDALQHAPKKVSIYVARSVCYNQIKKREFTSQVQRSRPR